MAKTGQELLAQLLAQSEKKRDLIAPTTALHMDDDGKLRIPVPGFGESAGTPHDTQPVAAGQLAQYLGIPKRYYDRCAEEAPELLAEQVNGWSYRKPATDRRLLRTWKGESGRPKLRAVLSPRYRIMDNYDLIRETAPTFEAKDVVPFRAFIREDRLDLSLTSQRITAELAGSGFGRDTDRHDIQTIGPEKMIPVLNMGNSEVGRGGLSISIGVAVSACRNLYLGVETFSKIHLGRETQGEGLLDELLSDEAREAADRALWLQVRDLVEGTFTEERFTALMAKYAAAREHQVPDPVATIRLLAGREDLDGDRLLAAYMKQPEPTAFGITQALTLAAQDDQINDGEQARMAKIAGQAIEKNATGDGWASWLATDQATPEITLDGAVI